MSRSALDRTGLFDEPSYLTAGDPHSTPNHQGESRYHGKQILGTPPKRGKTPDVYFSKYQPLFIGEQYVDPEQSLRKTKPVPTAPPFIPTHPMKHGQGQGLFSPAPEYRSDGLYEASSPGAIGQTDSLRGIYASPGQEGGYGYAGTTFGTYEHGSDPYNDKLGMGKSADGKPAFLGASNSGLGVFSTDVISWNRQGSDAMAPPGAADATTPFYPSPTSKKGKLFSKTEHFDGSTTEAVRDQKLAAAKPFKPVNGGRTTMYTRSALTKPTPMCKLPVPPPQISQIFRKPLS